MEHVVQEIFSTWIQLVHVKTNMLTVLRLVMQIQLTIIIHKLVAIVGFRDVVYVHLQLNVEHVHQLPLIELQIGIKKLELIVLEHQRKFIVQMVQKFLVMVLVLHQLVVLVVDS